MKKTILLSLLAFTSIATQAQTQKEVKIRATGPVFMEILSRLNIDNKNKKKIVVWPDTENNSWHENIGILDNMPVVDIKSIYPNKKFEKLDITERYTFLCWQLTDEGDNTVLHCYLNMPTDIVQNLWLGNHETVILDKETGIIYQAKGTVPEQCYNKVFGVNGKKGTTIDMQIIFPRLPKTDNIAIYGVPNWQMRGLEVKSNLVRLEHLREEYDSIPQFHMAHMVKESVDYDKNNSDSWAVYNDAHLIKPVEENTMALWRTPDATYLAIATEQNWFREFYGRGGNTILLDQQGRQYKCKDVMGYPNDKIFLLEGYAGDYFAIVLVFEPLPKDVNTFTYIVPEGTPFNPANTWGANWSGKVISDLHVWKLRENQHLFKYHPRVVVK